MAKAVWDKKDPKSRPEKMTSGEKATAKKTAKRHGRSSPSLVDNINAMKAGEKKKKKAKKSAGKKKKSGKKG